MTRRVFTPETLERRYARWAQCIRGGRITCTSFGEAINERQMMYRARWKLREQNGGISPYDHLVIRVASGSPILEIGLPKDNVLEVEPLDVLGPDFTPADPRSVRQAAEEGLKDYEINQHKKFEADLNQAKKPIDLE